MEQLGGGGGRGSIANRILNHHRNPPSPSERLLGVFQPQSSSAAPPLELSEHDIFSSPSGSSSPSNVDPSPILSPTQTVLNRNKSHGILAALNDNIGTKIGPGSGSGARPVFNHKVSASASLSSSSSTSPAASFSSRIVIPKRPPPLPQVDRMRLIHQSAPVNVPVIPEAMRRRAMEIDEVLSEKDEEENGVILPPHEVVAARDSPMISFSVLEGAGRTLKGRDLRQDLSLGMMIGKAREHYGLYFFEDEPILNRQGPNGFFNSVINSKDSEIMLCHYRLGHRNFQYLKHLFPALFRNKSPSSLECEGC